MDSRYVFVYAAVNIFCILTALVILSKISYNVGSEHENRYFRGMTLCFLGFVILELLWIHIEGGIIGVPRALGSAFKIISTILIPFMVYHWFWFAEIKFRSKMVGNRVARVVTLIPFLAMLICYIVSIFNGMVFSIGTEGEVVPGPMYGLTGLVDNIYGIAIIIHAVILLVKEKVPYRRRTYITMIVFILLCTAGGIIDAVVQNTPIMPLANAFAFIFLFANLQETQIYNDALTGLNNRRRADEYIVESIPSANEENPLYLFVLDIDNFKHVNDSLGHLEGDKALRAAAKGIANTADRYRGFASRWGGDEFVIVANGTSANFAQDVMGALKEEVAKAKEEAFISYPLEVSVGFIKCTTPQSKMSDLIAKADAMLYEQKKLISQRVNNSQQKGA